MMIVGVTEKNALAQKFSIMMTLFLSQQVHYSVEGDPHDDDY